MLKQSTGLSVVLGLNDANLTRVQSDGLWASVV